VRQLSNLLATWRAWRDARRNNRALAEAREIVETNEWLIAMAGGRSPRPYSDSPAIPTPRRSGASPAKDEF
jgi:hypothetical protein